jgi:hypothetical protein
MNVVLWIVAGVLALVFFVSGGMKLVRPKDRLAASGLSWTEDFGTGTVKLIGALEVVAALALILPAVLGIAAVLVPLSALGLAVLMIGAGITHRRRKEPQMIVVNGVLFVLAVLVACGRFGPYPFTS